jgi:hypothetical protein
MALGALSGSDTPSGARMLPCPSVAKCLLEHSRGFGFSVGVERRTDSQAHGQFRLLQRGGFGSMLDVCRICRSNAPGSSLYSSI